MTSEEVKRFVVTTVILSLVILTALVWIIDSMVFGVKTLSRIPMSVMGTTFFWLFYFRWGWKWWILKYLFGRPRVDGTWVGHLESDWTRSGSGVTTVIPIVFVIRQTFSTLVVRSFTHDREGVSDIASLVVKANSDITYVSYIYALREEFTAGTGTQQGAAELRLHSNKTELRGEYWTNTKTRGRVLVQRKTRKLVSSYREADDKWPVSSWAKFDT